METDKIKKLLSDQDAGDQQPESVRTPVTVLFSDIKGSTAYFEKFGDDQGLAMVQRHNALLFPIIEGSGGRVVKTIGDAIMAVFADPRGALQGAIGMQRILESDRISRPGEEQIHIKVGLHSGPCIVKDKDVYGDVVNVASRVQNQTEPDQILITEDLLDAAKFIGVQCAQMGHTNMRGRIEPINIYAVAWSSGSNDQLIDEIQAQYEKKLKDAKRRQDVVEQEFEAAREVWRGERRRFTTEIDKLTEAMERAREIARTEVASDLHAEIRLHLEEAVRARQQVEQDFMVAQARWETEREQMKTQMMSLQRAAIESMEQSNNPTRLALAVREKLEARLTAARQDWEMQWDAERRRLHAEIDQLKKTTGLTDSPQKAAAKRAILEKLGKLPAGSSGAPGPKSVLAMERDFEEAKLAWDDERQQLLIRAKKAERDLQHSIEDVRAQIADELRTQYDPQLAAATRERERLSHDVALLTTQLTEERQRNSDRISLLEKAIPAAKEAVKKQVTAELQAEFDRQLEELSRLKTRGERRYQDESEEWEQERRRTRKQIAKLEEELKEAREVASKSRIRMEG
jgi:class 3 adenylate cyclase